MRSIVWVHQIHAAGGGKWLHHGDCVVCCLKKGERGRSARYDLIRLLAGSVGPALDDWKIRTVFTYAHGLRLYEHWQLSSVSAASQ